MARVVTTYVSNMLEPSWPYGMAVEVFSRTALVTADSEATDPAEREHVTPFIYWRPERFRLKSLVRSPNLSQPPPDRRHRGGLRAGIKDNRGLARSGAAF